MIHGWHLAFPRMHFGIMDGYPYIFAAKISISDEPPERKHLNTFHLCCFFLCKKSIFWTVFGWFQSSPWLTPSVGPPRWPRGRGRPGARLRLGRPAAGGGLRGRRRGAAAAGAASVAGGRGDAGWKLDDCWMGWWIWMKNGWRILPFHGNLMKFDEHWWNMCYVNLPSGKLT